MTITIDVIAPVEQEGTTAIVKSWYRNVGEMVAEGDPLVELETDKVAVEVPAPATGILSEILIEADGEVEPGRVLGRIHDRPETSGERPSESAAASSNSTHAIREPSAPRPLSLKEAREHRLSPSVRRLLREHDIDPSRITGTGKDHRVTRGDVQEFLRNQVTADRDARAPAQFNSPPANALQKSGSGEIRRVPHDSMRRRIAEHMSNSVRTAPHVTAVFEADFSAVIAHRNARKGEYLKRGVNLTYTTYMILACAEAMTAAPTVNSRWHDDYLEIFEDVNVGVGVALGERGLIVPVVNHAQRRTHFEVAEELDKLTRKARAGSLAPADVRGGTISISNHGTTGSLVASPIIINQPQSAILGVGKLEKRVVVRTFEGVDTILIRPMAFVSLTIDHRVLDGVQTNAWLTKFVDIIENWPVD